MREFFARVVRGDATRRQAEETGMALVLLLLLVWLFRRDDVYAVAAFAVQLANMVVSPVFRPIAVLWFGLSSLLGAVVSRVILTLVFLLVVTPVGFWRKMLGHDSLKLGAFKAGGDTVMKERNYTFTGRDLERPY
jgi:hypothetical protein